LDETFEAFDELIESGKIRYAGCSNFNGNQLQVAEDRATATFGTRFESTQAYYNILKRDLEVTILPHCEKFKMGVLVYGALGRGILTNKYTIRNNQDINSRVIKNPKIKKDFTVPVLNLLNDLSEFSFQRKWSNVSQLVIAWVLSRVGVTSAILGSRTVEQLKSNIEAANIKLKKDELEEIDRLVGDLNQYKNTSLGYPGEIFLM
jgi:aryl-alcohol dehydrogenase-like predicted oxidoreductase